MASEERLIAVARLVLDQANARLGEEQPTQAATYLALTQRLGSQIFALAEDILEHGMDPTTLPAVIPESARKFRVLEGNRRILVLKALESPEIIKNCLVPSRYRRWQALAREYAANPIQRVRCVIFDAEIEARHWIELRHSGANDGAGLVEWDSNDQDRYRSRHGDSSKRSTAGQIIDFVDRIDPPGEDASKRYITTLQRLVNTREVRDALGITVSDGDVRSWFPGSEVALGLSKTVNDLRYGEKDVTDLYYKPGRLKYIAGFAETELPSEGTRLEEPVRLADLHIDVRGIPQSHDDSMREDSSDEEDDDSTGTPGSNTSFDNSDDDAARKDSSANDDVGKDRARSGRARPPKPRWRTIPKNFVVRIPDGRINAIFYELKSLEIEVHTNACAVLLRVFVELSVDSYISHHSLLADDVLRGATLAKKMKEAASHMRSAGLIDLMFERAVIRMADAVGPIAASTVNFNQFVHNQHVYPRPSELITAWDELEPFVRQLWIR